MKKHTCSDCTHEVDTYPPGTFLLDGSTLWYKSFTKGGDYPWTRTTLHDSGGQPLPKNHENMICLD